MDPATKLEVIGNKRHRNAGVTVACDVVQESLETLFPHVRLRLPCPTRLVLEPALPIGIEDTFAEVGALLADPPAQVVAVKHEGLRNTGIAMTLDVPKELAETLLPPVGVIPRIPGPAGQCLKSALSISVEIAFGREAALGSDPPAQPVTINDILPRDARVAVLLDVVQESVEALLPSVGIGIPCPTGQLPEPAFASDVKCALAVHAA